MGPADVAQPSFAQFMQKPVRGAGLQERQGILSKMFIEGDHFMKGEEYDEQVMLDYVEKQVEDLRMQRARIGGDWAVASVVQTRRWRDYARSKFGSDLQFVVLDMDLEQQIERIRGRHGDSQEAIDMMKNIYKRFEPKAVDEENTIAVKITADMTPDDVARAILTEIK